MYCSRCGALMAEDMFDTYCCPRCGCGISMFDLEMMEEERKEKEREELRQLRYLQNKYQNYSY